jgi:hypothetical protein
MFLPVADFKVAGIPNYDKMTATCLGVLIASLLFDPKTLRGLSFCPHLIDIPIIAVCLCPLATAWANDPELTTHDGVSWCIVQFFAFGFPYLIGRIYFGNVKALRELTIGIFLGGVAYIPLCLFEIRMSPKLHQLVYGYLQHSVAQQARGRFFRPMVFMNHGLALALFMVAASLAGFWLWWTGSLLRVGKIKMPWLVVPLYLTTLCCQSSGATAFLGLGTICLLFCRSLRNSLLYLLILLLPVVYLTSRIAYNWDGQFAVQLANDITGGARAQSLDYRIENERQITDKAKERPVFGWGGYGRPFIVDENGNITCTPDSLWIIMFGTYGLLGVIAIFSLNAPLILLHLKLRGSFWDNPTFVGISVFSVVLALYSLDNLLNNFPNPLFLLGLGGLCGMVKAGHAETRPAAVPAMTRAAQLRGGGRRFAGRHA